MFDAEYIVPESLILVPIVYIIKNELLEEGEYTEEELFRRLVVAAIILIAAYTFICKSGTVGDVNCLEIIIVSIIEGYAVVSMAWMLDTLFCGGQQILGCGCPN